MGIGVWLFKTSLGPTTEFVHSLELTGISKVRIQGFEKALKSGPPFEDNFLECLEFHPYLYKNHWLDLQFFSKPDFESSDSYCIGWVVWHWLGLDIYDGVPILDIYAGRFL